MAEVDSKSDEDDADNGSKNTDDNNFSLMFLRKGLRLKINQNSHFNHTLELHKSGNICRLSYIKLKTNFSAF